MFTKTAAIVLGMTASLAIPGLLQHSLQPTDGEGSARGIELARPHTQEVARAQALAAMTLQEIRGETQACEALQPLALQRLAVSQAPAHAVFGADAQERDGRIINVPTPHVYDDAAPLPAGQAQGLLADVGQEPAGRIINVPKPGGGDQFQADPEERTGAIINVPAPRVYDDASRQSAGQAQGLEAGNSGLEPAGRIINVPKPGGGGDQSQADPQERTGAIINVPAPRVYDDASRQSAGQAQGLEAGNVSLEPAGRIINVPKPGGGGDQSQADPQERTGAIINVPAPRVYDDAAPQPAGSQGLGTAPVLVYNLSGGLLGASAQTSLLVYDNGFATVSSFDSLDSGGPQILVRQLDPSTVEALTADLVLAGAMALGDTSAILIDAPVATLTMFGVPGTDAVSHTFSYYPVLAQQAVNVEAVLQNFLAAEFPGI